MKQGKAIGTWRSLREGVVNKIEFIDKEIKESFEKIERLKTEKEVQENALAYIDTELEKLVTEATSNEPEPDPSTE